MGSILVSGVALYIAHQQVSKQENPTQTYTDPIATSSVQEQQMFSQAPLGSLYGGSIRQPQPFWPERQGHEASQISDNPIVNTLFMSPEYQKKMEYMIRVGEEDGMMYDLGAVCQLDPIIGSTQAPTPPMRVAFRNTGF